MAKILQAAHLLCVVVLEPSPGTMELTPTIRFVDSSVIYLLRELLGLCRDALLVRRVNLSEVQTFVSTFLKLSLQSLCLISRSSDMMEVEEETLLMFELKPKMSLLLLL